MSSLAITRHFSPKVFLLLRFAGPCPGPCTSLCSLSFSKVASSGWGKTQLSRSKSRCWKQKWYPLSPHFPTSVHLVSPLPSPNFFPFPMHGNLHKFLLKWLSWTEGIFLFGSQDTKITKHTYPTSWSDADQHAPILEVLRTLKAFSLQLWTRNCLAQNQTAIAWEPKAFLSTASCEGFAQSLHF